MTDNTKITDSTKITENSTESCNSVRNSFCDRYVSDASDNTDFIPELEPFFVTDSACPACQKDVVLSWHKSNIPYFGEIVFITSVCDCGYVFSDTMILSSQEPSAYSIVLETVEDLSARVIRSNSGTIEIPELGVLIEPGEKSESFVSNTEAVLRKVRAVVEMTTKWNKSNPEKLAVGIELMRRIDEFIECPESSEKITMNIKDPLGNSAIISSKSTSRPLTEKEISELKTGMTIFENNPLDE
ncbi:MAG: ZPR1 zinc finger domain-containing protein [Methanosarcinaceae archaeon]|nr:ZPR1 zinc finger domain-containing protein [Methanosarcinaceae archaeon]